MKIKLKHSLCYLALLTCVSVTIMVFSIVDTTTSIVADNFQRKGAVVHQIICNKIRTISSRRNEYGNLNTTRSPNETLDTTTSEYHYSIDVQEILDSLRDQHNLTNNSITYDVEAEIYNKEEHLKLYHEYLFTTGNFSNKNYKLLRDLFPSKNRLDLPYEDRIEKQLHLRLNHTTTKLILVHFHDPNLRTQNLQNSECEISNCRFTAKRSDLHHADAVIFRNIPKKLSRPMGKSNQLWIYSQLESPVNTYLSMENKHDVINWTATYRTDSVLTTPYGKFKPYKNITQLPKKSGINYAKNKKKLAAWFVSNCHSQNGRMDYVKELQKYAKIDIYGACGQLKCNRYSADCFQMLRRDYKFYLAFENTNCKDYITEKFFLNALENDVVPIVMGAHPNDYKKAAPPSSYIHVDEFESPRQLAEYMHILDANDEAYNSYFRWKETGEFMNTKFICRLCAMVQISHLFPMWYEDLKKWWKDDVCVSKKRRGDWATWKTKKQIPINT